MPQNFKPRSYSREALQLLAERFKLLSEPARLQLLIALEDGELNVTSLIRATSMSQANVSKHLGILMRAGMVRRRKEGTQSFYLISDRQILKLCDIMCTHIQRDFEIRSRRWYSASANKSTRIA
jgi:ArsR family transcriptional regulator